MQECLILLVGAARFELATPSPPDWCANRAALRSDNDKNFSTTVALVAALARSIVTQLLRYLPRSRMGVALLRATVFVRRYLRSWVGLFEKDLSKPTLSLELARLKRMGDGKGF